MGVLNNAEQEITDFHRAAQGWLSGRTERSQATLDRLTRQLASSFVTIMPDGTNLHREDMIAVMADGYGTRGGNFEIMVRNLHTLIETPVLTIVMFEEWQRFGSGKVTARQSTATLGSCIGNRNDLEWLLLHETWLPAEQLRQSVFDAA